MPFFQFFSIFSREIPLVSGTKKYTKNIEIMVIIAKSQNVAAFPIELRSGKKLNTTMKLKPKLDTVAALMARPLICKGMISEIMIQQTGPRLMAKEAM